MRAASQDLLAARLMGINVNRVIATAFAIGSLLAGVVGLLWSARVGKIDPLMGFYPVLKAFVASVIGGLGSLPGAVLGGYVLGSLEILLQGLLPSALTPFRDAFVFAILIPAAVPAQRHPGQHGEGEDLMPAGSPRGQGFLSRLAGPVVLLAVLAALLAAAVLPGRRLHRSGS